MQEMRIEEAKPGDEKAMSADDLFHHAVELLKDAAEDNFLGKSFDADGAQNEGADEKRVKAENILHFLLDKDPDNRFILFYLSVASMQRRHLEFGRHQLER